MTSQLATDNVLEHYELATQFNATKLEHAALAFLVEHAAAFQAEAAEPTDSNDSTSDDAVHGPEARSGLSYVYLLSRLHPALQVCMPGLSLSPSNLLETVPLRLVAVLRSQ